MDMKNLKYIIFSDFDGTISRKDTLDIIVDDIIGKEYRIMMDEKVYRGEITNNDWLSIIFSKIKISFPDAIDLIKNKTNNEPIDKYFELFYDKCCKKNVPIYIISSGYKSIICELLKFIDNQLIYSNDAYIDKNNNWNLIFNPLNKLEIINKLRREDYKTIYFGDGISDLCVVGHVDILYAKKNSTLEKYCKENNFDYIGFNDFSEINI